MANPRPSPVLRRVLGVGLPEAVEDVRQELGINPGTIVRDRELDARSGLFQPHLRRPAGANLTALDSTFQITCCSRLASPNKGPVARSIASSSWMPLAPAAGRTASAADSITSDSRTGPKLIWNLPVTIRETSSMSATSWA